MESRIKLRTCNYCDKEAHFYSNCPSCGKNLDGNTWFETYLYKVGHRWNATNWWRIKLIRQLENDGYSIIYWKIKIVKGRMKAI